MRDVMGEHGRGGLVDHLGLHHHAHLATGLDGVRALHALVGVRDLLELLEALDVGVERLLAGAGAGGRHGVGGLHEHGEHARGLHVVVVRLDGMDDVLLLAETARQVGADDGMAALDLVVDGLAQVVQEPRALGRDGVEPELRGHDAREVGHLERVVQHVLAVGGAVAQAAERAHELGMQVVDARVEGGLLARLLHALVHERLGLAEHLLDARRMDAPVGHEVLHGHAADLAANRVEARDGHALRGVVDDEVRAGELLKRADVAALAPDDAALEVV